MIATLVGSQDIPAGWPSLMAMLLVATGAILFSLGIIAEYIGVAVNMAMGRPLYLIVSDPADGPLGAGVRTAVRRSLRRTPARTPLRRRPAPAHRQRSPTPRRRHPLTVA